MDKLTTGQQQEIRKYSSEQLVAKLMKNGYDEDSLRAMSRSQLTEEWARIYLERHQDKSECNNISQQTIELERRKMEFEMEMRRSELKLREETDRNNLMLKDRELKLLEEKLRMKQNEQERNHERTYSTIDRTRYLGDALKHVLGTCPQNINDVPAYFEHVEKIFQIHNVEDSVKANLLMMNLSSQLKALLAPLSVDRLQDYEEIKRHIMKELKINPIKLREMFFTLRKTKDESYARFAAKLHNTLMYYLQSREVSTFEQVVNIICADRLKELLPRNALDFILTTEHETWMSYDVLAQAVDTYETSHSMGIYSKSHVELPRDNSRQYSSAKSTTTTTPGVTTTEYKNHAYNTRKQSNAIRNGLCFNCNKPGHLAKNCLIKRTTPTKEIVNVARAIVHSSTPTVDKLETQHNVHEHNAIINTNKLYNRSFIDITLMNDKSRKALIDSGAEICCISDDIIKQLNLPIVGKVCVTGIHGQSKEVDVVHLDLKLPDDVENNLRNIAPAIRTWFAVIPNLVEKILLTPDVVELLQTTTKFEVLGPAYVTKLEVNKEGNDDDGVKVTEPLSEIIGEVEGVPELGEEAVKVIEEVEDKPNGGIAERSILIKEQHDCESLKTLWKFAKDNRKHFIIYDELLYHQETILGHKVKQLCLPRHRIETVLRLAHDAPFAGHMAYQSTRYRVNLSFWFPDMDRQIKEYCKTCAICQLRSPIKTKERVPITPIPRNDELPFNHLIMDCIGPMIPIGDTVITKPEYNYALVVIDQFSRWPMAHPLKSLNAKAVCDILLQIFMTYSIPKIISSDCGTNFTSKLTQEMLKSLGCSPRFNTPGHPEASGVVERCNQTLKSMIFKLAQDNPRGWFRLLPYVLWSLRERPSSTTHVSPYTLIYGTLPRGPLTVLRESWTGDRELPLNIGRKPEEYLNNLRSNLELAKTYAEYYSDIEQQQYAHHYNLRSTERHYQLGDTVAILIPNVIKNKWCNQWQGPGIITQIKSPYSYIIELDGRKHHVHANKIRKFHERITVSNCSILREIDNEFGEIQIYDKDIPNRKVEINDEKFVHLNGEEKQQIVNVIHEFASVFSNNVGLCNNIQHRIHVTSDFKPKQLRAYKVPELLKSEVDKQLKEMIEQNIISPSDSEMASPVVCVIKKNGGVRLAIDYRYVNKYSAGDGFPTPDIPDILHKVGRAQFISNFDAKSGYWQIPMENQSKWLTAFVCDAGLFEFNRMPFGLKSASVTFIRSMNEITKHIREFTETFIDDMVVFSSTMADHVVHLRRFFEVIRDAGLTLNFKKSNFAMKEITFLGHTIGSGKIEPDRSKLEALDEIKPPTTKKEVRKMIGFFSYFRSFLPNLAENLLSITELTKKTSPIKVVWTTTNQNALDKVIRQLQQFTSLNTIDYRREFGLLVDASERAIGCCLIQWDDEKQEKPIAFASKKLTNTQSRWSTIEREAYAVIWALNRFKSWICLSKIKIFSDHNPLTFLTESTTKSSKLARWSLALQEFDIQFFYRPGNKNVVADFLSRIE